MKYFIFLSLLLNSCANQIVPNRRDLEGKITKIAKENHIPTLSVYVKSGNNVTNFQYKSVEKNIESITNYGIASTTKWLAAILILKNIEDKKIGLNESISLFIDGSAFKYCPWFKEITIKHLLNHTSGLPDYTKNEDWFPSVVKAMPPANCDKKIALINWVDKTYQFEKFAYSNTNYVILEKIIEQINKKKACLVFNEFYASIGLSNISISEIHDKNQSFFAQEINKNNNITEWQENYGFEGGAFATTKDLSAILRKVFIEKTVLNSQSLSLLTEWTNMDKYKIDFGFAKIENYGLGLMKYEFAGRLFIGHAGSSLKYQSFAFIDPNNDDRIILQTNCSGKYYNHAFLIKILEEIVKKISESN